MSARGRGLAAALLAPSVAAAQPRAGVPLDTEVAPPPEATTRERGGPVLRVAMGGAYRRLYASSILAGELSVSLGHARAGVEVAGSYGASQNGRALWSVRLGATAQGRTGRVELGGGFHAGFLAIERATARTSHATPTLGIFVLTRVDLLAWRDRALFLGLRGGVELVGGVSAVASAELGVRY